MTDNDKTDLPDSGPTSAEPAAAAPKPRRRRTRAPAAESGTDTGSSPVAEAPAGGGAEGGGAGDATASASSVAGDQGESAGAAPSGDGGAGESAGGSEPKRKRHRNRRRKGRGGERGEDAGAERPPVAVTLSALPPTDINDLFAAVLSGDYDVEPVDAGPASAEAAAADGAVAAGEADATAATAAPDADAADAADAAEQTPAGGDEAGEPAAEPGSDETSAAADPGEPARPAAAERPAGAPSQPGAGRGDRRVLPPEPEAPKLQKVLAQAGVGSRRDLEQMITEGRIHVNGQPAHTGQRIKFGDRITLDGKPVRVRINPPPPRVIAYHKPVGEVVTHDDPQARPTVFRRLPRLQQGKWQSVGRLDINTEGLLLFTNSGDLANRLMHPRFGVEREYAVRVLGTLSDEERQQLLDGVEIDGQTAAFRSIADGGGEGVNRWYRVVISEGRNREVRKLFDTVGKAVSRLIRIRYGSVVLPRGLKRGVWVDLGPDDLKTLRAATGMPERAPAAREERQPAGEGGGRGARRGGRGGRQGRRGEPGQSLPPGQSMGRVADFDGDDDDDGPIGPIPNPLQQTYDKRAFQQSRRQERDIGEDGPIPNPLQQTYDKRAVQSERQPRREISEDGPIPNPLQQTYDKRFAPSSKPGPKRGGGGGGRGKPGGGRGGAGGAGKGGGGGGQPDPMRTAVGYIGGDAFMDKLRRKNGGGGGGGGGGRGGRGGRGGGGGGKGR